MTDIELIRRHRDDVFSICKGNNDPRQYQKPNTRLWTALTALPFFEGSNLIDVGSCTGMHSMVASRYCNSVAGIEPHPVRHERALELQKYFKNISEYDVSKVKMWNKKLSDIQDISQFDAVLACCVIYHLDSDDLEVLSVILKNSNKVILQIRPKRGRATNDMWKPKSAQGFLENLGFRCTYDNKNKFHPLMMGQK